MAQLYLKVNKFPVTFKPFDKRQSKRFLLDDVWRSVDWIELAEHCNRDHVLNHPIVSDGPLDNLVHNAMELVAV